MADAGTRAQRQEERRRRILEVARSRADAHGWAAVTTRQLSAEIGFTQPVLYGHFPAGKAQIVQEVAIQGFVELAETISAALRTAAGAGVVTAVAVAYLDFAAAHPAVYEAMFAEPVGVSFASADTPAEVRAGFDVLAGALGDHARGVVTELFWGALHGVSELERAGRMRPEHRAARVSELAARFAPPGRPQPASSAP